MVVKRLPTIPERVEFIYRTTSQNIEDVTKMLKRNSWTCFPGDADTSRVFVREGISGRNGTHLPVLHMANDHAKIYILCDVNIPESRRPQVAEYIHSINHTLHHGSFELNVMNGELRYKQDSIKDEVVTPTVLGQLIASSLLIMDHHYPKVLGIVHGLVDPTTASCGRSLTLTV